MNEHSKQVRYRSYHLNIKFISSPHSVIIILYRYCFIELLQKLVQYVLGSMGLAIFKKKIPPNKLQTSSIA